MMSEAEYESDRSAGEALPTQKEQDLIVATIDTLRGGSCVQNNGYNPRVENCYFCSSRDLKPHSQATYWREFPLDFVECAECKLIFANPMPNLETVIKGNRALNVHHVSRGTFSQYRGGKEFAMFLQSLKPGGTMLDVGCAEGFFLLGVAENSNWKAEGIEILEGAVEFATTRLGLAVHRGPLEELAHMTARYDFIRMNNVIEHVQNPVRFLQCANQLLKKAGRIYCSTPNGFQDGHVLKTANRRGLKINLLENHFFYYHPKTLVKIFHACGFKIQKSYCEDPSHTLNDFGLLPWFKYPREPQNFALSAFQSRTNEKFHVSEEDIRSYKHHPTLQSWRLKYKRLQKKFFRIHFPTHLPIGHQLHVSAEKI